MNRLGDLEVYPLCLGGNVFGWTADEEQSFGVLDAYAEAGGNFIDTADVYSEWNKTPGASESIIGRWMASRGNRDQLVIATKVGMLTGYTTLSPALIQEAAENSLRRLGTDRIDLYYAHQDDESTPLEQTLTGLDALVRDGKVRYLGASNYSATRLAAAQETAVKAGLTPFVAFQPPYNLVNRAYEGELAETVAAQGIACIPYYGLARGFLTGKYRPGDTNTGSPRAAMASKHLDPRGLAVLAELDTIAAARETTLAAVALAWVAAQPTVLAPIASARSVTQLASLLPMVDLRLTDDELITLGKAGS